MNDRLKKVLAVIVLVVIIFGWYVTLFGIPGTMKPLKDQIQLGLDVKGGVYVVLEAQGLEGKDSEEVKKTMEQTQAVIEKRVDQMGIANPVVSIEAGDRIRVELPGADNAEEAIKQIGRTAQLKFTLANGAFVLDGGSVKNATTGRDDKGQYAVDLELNSKGAKAFEAATTTTAAGGVQSTMEGVSNNAIVITLDNEIISAPTATSVITGGKCNITGNFSKEEAVNLAALIRGGSLPVELKEVTSSAQTAKIGLDALEKSVYAGLIGVGLILVIMLVGYRIMGVAANIALALYVILILWIMTLMGSVLTLPGIAGIILSIGMAVDANAIIFSRIKDEIINGKSIRVATQTGYKRAMSTVIDSQVTTLIAAIILYQMGTSAVKGFAWTLMIGIFASIFTAVIVTQLYLGILANSKTFGKKKFFGIKEDNTPALNIKRQFKFIKNRKIFYIVSVAIIVTGLLFAGIKGFNYGIDFTGGTMLHLDMGKKVETSQIKDVMKEHNVKTNQMEIVYSGDNYEEVIIKTNESLDNKERDTVISSLKEKFNLKDDAVLASEHFGASVGKELKSNALKAILLSAIGMLIYIRIRFRQWKFGAAALLGTLHDVLIVVTFYLIFQVTVNNPFIAAILTVVGYSMNDTIVIFDRIRENLRFMKKGNQMDIIDTSINQTLSRSITTSATTLIVMIPLYVMTSSAIREFVLPLMIGVLAGCLSSIFVCSPLFYEFSKKGDTSKYEKHVAGAKKAQKKVKVEEPKEDEDHALSKGHKKPSRKARTKK